MTSVWRKVQSYRCPRAWLRGSVPILPSPILQQQQRMSVQERARHGVRRPSPLAAASLGRSLRGGRGRLIVGVAGLSSAAGPSTAELSESIDRLTEVMNQQVMVQIAMIQRMKVVEGELAALKLQAGAQEASTRCEVGIRAQGRPGDSQA